MAYGINNAAFVIFQGGILTGKGMIGILNHFKKVKRSGER